MCYGDSRTITPVGGSLDPSSFGAFFYSPITACSPAVAHSQWTFEVQTQDSWSLSAFGDWTVLINTDGLTDGCQGWNYFAQVSQPTTGTFQAEFGPLNSTCSFIPNQAVSGAITGNAVSVSIPESAIGNAPTLTWSGVLQTFPEESQGGGNFVPCNGNPACGGVTWDGQFLPGAVAESLPGTTPTSCSTNPSTTQVVTLPTPSPALDLNAVTALTNARLTNVRNYDPPLPAAAVGVISFTGSTATAQTALAPVLGIPPQQVPIAPAQAYTPQAISTTGTSATPVGTQWNLGVIGAAGAQSVSKGNGVVVADIDTGLDYLDPNLVGANLLNGFDESTGTAIGLGPKTPSLPEIGNTDIGQLNAGDGTAVAGMMAAVSNSTNGTALTSLGLDTRILPIKVNFDDTAHVSAEIDAGIRWAANNGAQIVNLPFAGVCPDANLQSAITYAQGKGDLVVAAAGDGALNPNLDKNNGSSDAPAYPAAYATMAPGQDNVVAVGATGGDGIRASYSDTGSFVSMVAPGGSAIPGDTADDLSLLAPGDQCPGEPCYTTGAGTALAAAQASAEAALIWAVNPTLTASQTGELLTSTTTDRGVAGTDVEYGTGMENASVALTDTPPSTPGYGTFFSVSPFRILDTRFGTGAPPQPIGPGQSIALTVTGTCPPGVPPSDPRCIPASGVTAVILNVTVTGPSSSSYLTVWPDGQTRPNSSNINFNPGQTLPNLVTVKVNPSDGQVDIFNAGGTVNVIADIGGYYVDGSGATGSTFVPVSPVRLLDTRFCSAGAPGCPAPGPIGGGVSRTLPVTGIGWPLANPTITVPNTATGVVLNVTVTGPTAGSYVALYPANLSSPPSTSNLNFSAGQTVPNLVSVRLGFVGLGPAEGVKIFNAAGNVHVIVDLEGYFTALGDHSGSRFFPLVSHRILDTRANVGNVSPPANAFGPVGPNTSISAAIIGQGGVLDGGSAVVMNATVTSPTQPSYLSVYPSTRPVASNLNFSGGQTIANLVSVAIGQPGGRDNFFNAAGTVEVISDVQGWYGPLAH
jgi:hypothetical protein